MMKRLIILFILIVIVLVAGCTQTPANVAKEVPGILSNISEDISAMETPNITLESVLHPLKTSMDYVQPARIVPTPITLKSPDDPIVGEWVYSGETGYQCRATFDSDSKASAWCSSWGITLIQKSFVWTPVPNPFNWMRNYTITDVSDRDNYTIMYSERTGRMTSDIIPGNGYLMKVS